MTSQPDMFGAPDVGGARHELDAYDTPAWATRALLDFLTWRLRGAVWEPCAGAGKISEVLSAAGLRVFSSDVVPRAEGITTVNFFDAQRDSYVDLGEATCWVLPTDPIPHDVRRIRGENSRNHDAFDWIVTNPPYTLPDGTTAADFWRHACGLCDRVAMLLRVGWIEPCEERERLFEEGRPLTDLVVLPRVSFIGAPKGNNQTSCWYVSDLVDPPPPGMVRMRRYTSEIREPTYWQRSRP